MLLSVSVLILFLGFGEAYKQPIDPLDADERPWCPCDPIRPRVVGRQEADNKTFPYASYIVVDDFVTTCGATLITDRHVITAAHCFDKLDTVRVDLVEVHVGHYDHRIEQKHRCRPKSIVLHPKYNSTMLMHDIALVELDQKRCGPVTWSNGMLTAVLAMPWFNLRVHKFAIAYGGGMLEIHHSYPTKLISVRVMVLENTMCHHFFGYFNKDAMLCASGSRGTGTCKGDSGGGLLVPLDDNYVLAGVVSFGGPRCPPDEVPGVYARVSNYVGWIYENTMSSGCKPCRSDRNNRN